MKGHCFDNLWKEREQVNFTEGMIETFSVWLLRGDHCSGTWHILWRKEDIFENGEITQEIKWLMNRDS